MIAPDEEYKISKWFAEFADPRIEEAFQRHFQQLTNRQLRGILFFWAALNLLFAIPDYIALGQSGPFFWLLAYRVVLTAVLVVIMLCVKPETSLARISYAVAATAVYGFTGFMLFFIFRPDAVNWVVGVIMLLILGLLMFVPIRFYLAFWVALYGVVITLLTRYWMGSSRANLIGLFFLLILPFLIGAATTRRFAVLQRKQFALSAQTAKINRELEGEIKRRLKLEAILKELAATDPLTGLYNRREYEMLFTRELERARRKNAPWSLAILDLDHFKAVNDRYGHAVGDEVLRRVAKICREHLRSIDIIGRLGGEEFIILLPDTAIDEAFTVGTRLLKALAAAEMEAGQDKIKITATIGISQLLPGDPDINAVIGRADAALYRGKAAGRNRVEANLISSI